MINVLQVLSSLDRGGAETLIGDYCKYSSNNNIRLHLIGLKSGYLQAELADKLDCEVFARRNSLDIRLILRFRKFIKANKIQVTHCHQPIDAVHLYLATLGLKTKRAMTYHGYNHINSLKFSIMYKPLLKMLDANIFVSKFLQRTYEIRYGIKKNNYLIYNGIAIEKFDSAIQKDIRDVLGLPSDAVILGMVGNFNVVRDQMTVCKALPQIFSLNDKIHFIFIGRKESALPQYYDRCYDFCLENNLLYRTHFMGLRTDVPSLLSSFDLFVYSSVQDTFGMAVVEAMISKVPCIISDIVPFREISDNGKTALLYESQDHIDLFNTVKKALSSEFNLESLTLKALSFVTKHFSIMVYEKKANELYEQLVCDR